MEQVCKYLLELSSYNALFRVDPDDACLVACLTPTKSSVMFISLQLTMADFVGL